MSTAPLLLLGLITLSAPTPRLRIDLVFEGSSLTRRLEMRATAEAAGIWARYGVDIALAGRTDAIRDGATPIPVVVAERHQPGQSPDVLGSILLRADSAPPVITIYDAAITTLLHHSPVPSWALDEASPLRDAILGRAVGRALAHEIGHYLLRLPHARAGLMRAKLQPADLVGFDEHPFWLSGDEAAHLQAVLMAAQPPR